MNWVSRLIRLPLRLIPNDAVMPILAGPARGAKWIARSSNNGCWIGTYEPEGQRVFAGWISPGDVVYDLGANVGFYTVLAARRGATVHAFEPDPENVALLRRHVSLNHLTEVTIHQVAVSDRVGEARFAPNKSMGHLAQEGIPMRTVTLDSLVEDGLDPPSVIKMDVEGAELDVLNGATNVLRKYRPAIVCSLHGRIRDGVDVDQECLKILRSLGYRCERMPHGDFRCECRLPTE